MMKFPGSVMILSAIFVARSSSIKLPNFSVITAKKNLLTYVKPLARGTSCSKEEKQRVECLVDDLMIAVDASNMNRDFATSPIVSGKWRLEYTTEAELLSLMGNPETVVTQSINMNNRGFLQNYVGFAGGWCDGWEFTVDSSISGQGMRSSFEFSSAKLVIPSPPLKIPLPPVGKGWFDNLYVDDTIRVNRESRGNTVVYSRIK